jgi:uncharacterized integral membrane protein
MIVIYLLMALIGAGVAMFAIQNLDPVVIRFLSWKVEGTPLAMVIMLSIMTGLVLAALVGFVHHLKLRRRIRHLEGRLTAAGVTAAQPGAPTPPAPVDRPRA